MRRVVLQGSHVLCSRYDLCVSCCLPCFTLNGHGARALAGTPPWDEILVVMLELVLMSEAIVFDKTQVPRFLV